MSQALGDILFENQALSSARAQPALRRRMNMIFQDPYASLNPRWRVRDIVAEPIRVFGLATRPNEVQGRVGSLLAQVGLTVRDGEKYPHEFSGGQRQRISIARASPANRISWCATNRPVRLTFLFMHRF